MKIKIYVGKKNKTNKQKFRIVGKKMHEIGKKII